MVSPALFLKPLPHTGLHITRKEKKKGEDVSEKSLTRFHSGENGDLIEHPNKSTNKYFNVIL